MVINIGYLTMYNRNQRVNIFNAISRAILIIDLNYRIVDANQAACQLMNLPYSQIVGQSCHHLSHRNTKPCWEIGETYCPVKLSIENKRPIRVVHKHKHDIATKVEEIIATPVFDEAGDLIYVVEELRDMSGLLHREAGQPNEKNSSEGQQYIPICASCKKIRDDHGRWQPFEHYLGERLDAHFSHSICPECKRANYPELNEIR